MSNRFSKRVATLVVSVSVTIAAVTFPFLSHSPRILPQTAAASEAKVTPTDSVPAKLVGALKDTLELSSDAVEGMGLRIVRVESAAAPDPLLLHGSLFMDPNRVVRVHSRFPGEVVDLGSIMDTSDGVGPDGERSARRLRFGDPVKKGELLAIVWSKEVGDVKSDLVDAVSKLRLDKTTLESLQKLGKEIVSARSIREAQRNYESDLIAIKRAERTLRSWHVSEEEIEAIRTEANEIFSETSSSAEIANETRWAEVQLRAPFDGVILEQNAAVGDIVDTNLDLFKIADLSRLGVMANIYEEDLATLLALAPADRKWSIRLASNPHMAAFQTVIERIGDVIDPVQHTAPAICWIENPEGKLRVGQFVTASVPLPAPHDEVVLPIDAVIEEGAANTIFVADGPQGRRFTRRRVAITGRSKESVSIRSMPSADETAAGAEPIKPGEWIVASRVLQLSQTLTDLSAGQSVSSK